MTRKERYEASLKAREAGKAKEGTFYPKEEHPEYLAMEKGELALFRPMTLNHETDPQTPFDHRMFYYSFMKDDNGKFFPFKWGFEAWTQHPIYQIVKKVAKYDYNKELERKDYINEGCELLLDITKNGITDKNINNGWWPTKTLLMNVIDRMDTWCKENKHSKVITTRAEFDDENDRWKTDYGFKIVQYNEMCAEAEKQMGSLCDFDFATLKYKTPKGGKSEKKQYYETFIAEVVKPYLKENFGEEYVKALYEGYDEEEMSYEMYNFEEMDLYKPSSIGMFLSKKSQFVKDVDKKYGTSFFEELTKLANKEKANNKSEATSESVEESEESVEESYSKPEEEKAEEPKTSRRGKAKEETKPEANFDPKDLPEEEFKGISELSKKELDGIIGINDDGSLIFTSDMVLEACEKDHCKMEFPVDFKTCPYCSASYE